MEIREMVCINCPLGCHLTVRKDKDGSVSVSGNTCPRGEAYGRSEVTNPVRMVTTTVPVKGKKNAVVSVKTKAPVPKNKIMECMKELKNFEVEAPVEIGDVLLKNVAGTGISIVATANYGR